MSPLGVESRISSVVQIASGTAPVSTESSSIVRGRSSRQGRRCNLVDVAHRNRRIPVAGKHHLALLRQLEASVDRVRRLGKDRGVGGPAATPKRTTPAVKER